MLVVAARSLRAVGLKAEVLGRDGVIELGNAPTHLKATVLVALPMAGRDGRPLVGLVFAVLNLVIGDHAVVAAVATGVTRQVAQGLDARGLLELHGDPQLIGAGLIVIPPVGVEVGRGVVVERELDRALIARSRAQLAASGLGLDVRIRHVALVAIGGQIARTGIRSQVDNEGLARSVILGLKDDVDLVVMSRKHRDGGVLGCSGVNRCEEGCSRVAALLEVGGAELLAVNRQAIECSLGIGVEAALCLKQLNLGHSDAGLSVRKRHVLVGEGEPDKRCQRRLKVIGVGRNASVLSASGFGRSHLAPSLAVLGHLDLGGAGVGIACRPGIVNKVHDGSTDALLRVVVKGHARGLIALLGIVVIRPAALVGTAAGSMGGNTIVDGRKGVGLLALGNALRDAHESTAVSDVVADSYLLVLNANGSGNGQVLTKNVGGAVNGHGAGLGVGVLGRSLPRNGEVRVKDSAVSHGGRARIGKRRSRSNWSCGGVVQKRCNLIEHGNVARDLDALDLTGNRKGTGLSKGVLVDALPGNVLLLARAVGVVDVNLLGQGELAAGLYIVEAGVGHARDRLRCGGRARRGRGNGHGRGSKAVGSHGDGDVATLAVGAHDTD